MTACACKFFPRNDSLQHKIIVHLLPNLVSVAACAALGLTLAKINAMVGLYYFVITTYMAFEPHEYFMERSCKTL